MPARRQRPSPLDVIAADAAAIPTASPDKLDRLRARARELIDAEAAVVAAEAALETAKEVRTRLSSKELPAIFEEAGSDSIGFPELECDVVLTPYYHASLSSERMTPEALQAGFDHLEALGGGDLIRTQVIVPFPREALESARALLVTVQRKYPEARLDRSVQWQTLTSFLREMYEREPDDAPTNRPTPNLDALGATVAKVCRVKRRKKR